MCSTSRGIGLELTKRLLENPENFIIATCRDVARATALQALKDTAKGTLHIIRLDVDETDGIERSYDEVEALVGDRGLDYLVNNAAIVRLFSFQGHLRHVHSSSCNRIRKSTLRSR